ncbi:MAG: sel1 repeat family protein [Alphaproteobacteria bacterium]|nr:sel1 repeat family protein [Alphaproteobacteria bacterium]
MGKFFKIVWVLMLFFSIDASAQNIVQGTSDTAKNVTHDTLAKQQTGETVEDLMTRAKAGDEDALLDLGYMFLYGANGVNIDYKAALSYYQQAAELGNATAYNNLGSLYFNGIGTEADYKKAISYFEKAAQAGSSDAAVNLAIIYLRDVDKNNIPSTFKKVKDLLLMAQEKNLTAKYLSGYAYKNGILFNKDMKKAFSFIKQAADEGYDEAQYVLSEFYINGTATSKNYARAVEYLQKAAKQGHPPATMQLADILSLGEIYPQDIKQAYILYNTAAGAGISGAAGKRDELEKKLGIEDLLAAQAEAENIKPEPTEQTKFIRQTFGESLKKYLDSYINLEITQE